MEDRRAIVAILWGKHRGRKAAIAPGETLRVGRGEVSDLVVPSDEGMAAVHVEITWDGQRCRFRDLGAGQGTVVNGQEGIREGDLQSGDWLKMGETVLTLHVEGASPPRPVVLDELERERRARAEKALATLEAAAEEEPLYAVLDAARAKRILELCRSSVEEHHSLYDGIQGEGLDHVAPYLVRLRAGSRLLASLVREGFGKRWGIWLLSRQQPREVRRHLRRFLMVEIEGMRGRVYFRFYDPSALVSFLSTSSPRQLEELFGDTLAFFAETRSGELRRISKGQGALAQERLA